MRTRASVSLALFLLLVATASDAHHGWSGYDNSKELSLTGVIRESGYEHPHGHLRLEAPGKTWTVVLAPPSRMERRGPAAKEGSGGTPAPPARLPQRTHPPATGGPRDTPATHTPAGRLGI